MKDSQLKNKIEKFVDLYKRGERNIIETVAHAGFPIVLADFASWLNKESNAIQEPEGERIKVYLNKTNFRSVREGFLEGVEIRTEPSDDLPDERIEATLLIEELQLDE